MPIQASLIALVPANLTALWARVEGIDQTLRVDPNVWITGRLVSECKCTGAVIFPNSLRTGLEMWLGGVPFRAGFVGRGRRSLLHVAVEREPLRTVRHQAMDYVRMVEVIAGAGAAEVGDLPQLKGIEPHQRPGGYLAICPGAEYGPAKRWGAARFAAAGALLRDALGLAEVVVLGGPKDVEEAAKVTRALGESALDLAGGTRFDEFLSWLAGARLILCNDSGAMHLAALLRVPCVAVFGSTEPKLTGPLGTRVAVVREHVACSPCFLRECPLDSRCMSGVTVDRVVAAGLEVAE